MGDDVVRAVVSVAAAWQDPDHGPRAAATDRTMLAPNRFTEEAVAFAVNHWMRLLTADGLQAWIRGRTARRRQVVGVVNEGRVPMGGLRDWLAVLLSGHAYRGSVSPASPYLLPAFAGNVADETALPSRFVSSDALFAEATAVIADVADETADDVVARCTASGIPSSRRLLRPRRFGVAVLDGRETEDALERLAEDILLHEGLADGSIALVWAPVGVDPDELLAALAAFRSVFPAHVETPGALMLQRAFLAAREQPHAYADGLEFLISKGPPERQLPGHVRWSEYATLDEVRAWLAAHADRIDAVVACAGLAERLRGRRRVLPPGEVHRRRLEEERGDPDVLAFLEAF